jgi:hypothetical protein
MIEDKGRIDELIEGIKHYEGRIDARMQDNPQFSINDGGEMRLYNNMVNARNDLAAELCRLAHPAPFTCGRTYLQLTMSFDMQYARLNAVKRYDTYRDDFATIKVEPV